MRITGGSLRGRRLKAPKGMAVRPTTDKVREALFSILGAVDDLDVLDLCAGSGALGLEALSRGARAVTFVDNRAQSLSVLKQNVDSLGLSSRAVLRKGACPRALIPLASSGAAFHLIFADPPYGSGVLTPTLEAVAAGALLRPGGVMICEHDRDEALPESVGEGALVREEARTYGRTVLSFYGRGDGARPTA